VVLRRSLSFSFAVLCLLVACGGGRTQTRRLPDDASVSSGDGGNGGDGIVVNECAPADGPALQFVFNLDPPALTCTRSPLQKGQRQLTFYVWGTALPKGPGEVVVQGGSSAPSTASVCTLTTSTNCVSAIGGTLTLTSFNPSASTASGSYSVNMKNGETVTGTFSATQCHNVAMCG
jgi:hypothetical protein